MVKELKTIEKRPIAIKALVGSHNYNLNTEFSDIDYKYFVYPTLDDLYDGKMFAGALNSPTHDYTIHDIRKLYSLLCKVNINFLEVLFSKDLEADDEIKEILHPIREDFINAHRYAFYKACLGTYQKKNSLIYKVASDESHTKTNFYLDTYGYNVKEACHALRVLKVAQRYFVEKLCFEESIWFDGEERLFFIVLKGGLVENTQYTEKSQELLTILNTLPYAKIEGDIKSVWESERKCKKAEDQLRTLIKSRIINERKI